MESGKYIITFKENNAEKKIRITSEQKKLLNWLYDNDYFSDWEIKWGGNLIIEEEICPMIDLTI